MDRLDTGRKDDQGKIDWNLLPVTQAEEVIKVLMFGAQKYGRHNWQGVKHGYSRYRSAAIRHVLATQPFSAGNDEETGLSHEAHAICCLLFMMWHKQHILNEISDKVSHYEPAQEAKAYKTSFMGNAEGDV